jgi:hypothetical protein
MMARMTDAETTTDRMANAYQEAGHALLLFALGHPPARVTIRPTDETLETAKRKRPDEETPSPAKYQEHPLRPQIEAEIIATFGGGLAMSNYKGRAATVQRERDHHGIAILLSYISGWEDVKEAFAEYCWRQARRLIEWHWPEIQGVAQALLERTTLTRGDVAEVILSIPVEVLEKHRLREDSDTEERKAS